MIVDYFKSSLFPLLAELHAGYTTDDINISNIGTFTDYEVITERVYPDPSEDEKYFKFDAPQKSNYNILVGYSSLGTVVFIKGILLNISGYDIENILFDIVRDRSGVDITFDITKNLTYSEHTHPEVSLNVNPISKFTNYLTELTDDEINFSKGKIIDRSWLSDLNSGVCLVGLDKSAINDMHGVYGIDFRFEELPSNVLKLLPQEIQDTPNIYNFTYRGETICYKKSSNEYHIVRDGVNVQFGFPMTLINEFTAVRSNGTMYHWNGSSWITISETCNLVIYRAAFKLDSGLILRIL